MHNFPNGYDSGRMRQIRRKRKGRNEKSRRSDVPHPFSVGWKTAPVRAKEQKLTAIFAPLMDNYRWDCLPSCTDGPPQLLPPLHSSPRFTIVCFVFEVPRVYFFPRSSCTPLFPGFLPFSVRFCTRWCSSGTSVKCQPASFWVIFLCFLLGCLGAWFPRLPFFSVFQDCTVCFSFYFLW